MHIHRLISAIVFISICGNLFCALKILFGKSENQLIGVATGGSLALYVLVYKSEYLHELWLFPSNFSKRYVHVMHNQFLKWFGKLLIYYGSSSQKYQSNHLFPVILNACSECFNVNFPPLQHLYVHK